MDHHIPYIHPEPTAVEGKTVKLCLCVSTTSWRCISCLINHHSTKTYSSMEIQALHAFLTSALDGGWVVTIVPQLLTQNNK